MNTSPSPVALSRVAQGLSTETAFDVLAVARKLKAQGKDVIELQTHCLIQLLKDLCTWRSEPRHDFESADAGSAARLVQLSLAQFAKFD